MRVGLLLVTHPGIGSEMLTVARTLLDDRVDACATIEVGFARSDTDKLVQKIRRLADELDQGCGVLLLSDLYGASPANLAQRALAPKQRIVHGLNLAMLMRALDHAESASVDELADKCLAGGHRAILDSSA